MITYSARTDITKFKTDALVNTVNCVGVMGKGVALEFKRAFPDNYALYREACSQGSVEVGKMFITDRASCPRFIINFPTKKHWRNNSELSWIEQGLKDLATQIRERKIHSLVMPKLGCGNGGLLFKDVEPLIHLYLSELYGDIAVLV